MSKGYLIFAQNSDVDYLKQAVALSASLKASGNFEPVSVVTNNPVPDKYENLFDQIIPIPWGDNSVGSIWKVENRWKLYHVTPYDETIVLDSDIIVTENMSTAWSFFSEYDLYFTSTVYDYKARPITDTENRKAFISNNLPNVYFGLHYFKKTDFCLAFYKQLEEVVKNYKIYYKYFTPNNTQQFVSMDVSSAIAIKILDIENLVTCRVFEPIKFIHMKSNLQQLALNTASWQSVLDCNLGDNLLIGNHVQRGVFHYVENDFLTDEIFNRVIEHANS